MRSIRLQSYGFYNPGSSDLSRLYSLQIESWLVCVCVFCFLLVSTSLNWKMKNQQINWTDWMYAEKHMSFISIALSSSVVFDFSTKKIECVRDDRVLNKKLNLYFYHIYSSIKWLRLFIKKKQCKVGQKWNNFFSLSSKYIWT